MLINQHAGNRSWREGCSCKGNCFYDRGCALLTKLRQVLDMICRAVESVKKTPSRRYGANQSKPFLFVLAKSSKNRSRNHYKQLPQTKLYNNSLCQGGRGTAQARGHRQTQHGTAQHSMTQTSMAQHSTAHDGTDHHGMAQHEKTMPQHEPATNLLIRSCVF